MSNYHLFRELAENNNLQFVETTSAHNGYPENLEPALIGFNTWEEAEAFAEENGLILCELHKRDGWQLWGRGNQVIEPFNITYEDYGDNYDVIGKDRASSYYEEEIKPIISEFDSLDDLEDFIDKKRVVVDELENMEDDEAVVTYCGVYDSTIKPKCMEWGFDTHNYVIGAMAL